MYLKFVIKLLFLRIKKKKRKKKWGVEIFEFISG